MSLTALLLALSAVGAVFACAAYYKAAGKAQAISHRDMHSRPAYHAAHIALWCGLPALGMLLLWLPAADSLIRQMEFAKLKESAPGLSPVELELLAASIFAGNEAGPTHQQAQQDFRRYSESLRQMDVKLRATLAISVSLLCGAWAWTRVKPRFQAREKVERALQSFLFLCACIAILTAVGIVLSVLFEALRFFQMVSPAEFLFSPNWSPQIAIREDQVAADGSFGSPPLLLGTLLISAIAISIAAPTGLFSAIYLAEYAGRRARAVIKPLLEILAGIPTVVYGFFAALALAPWIRSIGERLSLDISSESALAAGVVMAVMVIPLVSSLSNDVISTARAQLRDASLALGATRSETMVKVILPAALPGISSSMLLAISRAIGETMIVVMAAGLAANLTLNPLESTTTITVQIVSLLVGDQEFDSPKTLATFALGLQLFVITLALNFTALRIVRRYSQRYG